MAFKTKTKTTTIVDVIVLYGDKMCSSKIFPMCGLAFVSSVQRAPHEGEQCLFVSLYISLVRFYMGSGTGGLAIFLFISCHGQIALEQLVRCLACSSP